MNKDFYIVAKDKYTKPEKVFTYSGLKGRLTDRIKYAKGISLEESHRLVKIYKDLYPKYKVVIIDKYELEDLKNEQRLI